MLTLHVDLDDHGTQTTGLRDGADHDRVPTSSGMTAVPPRMSGVSSASITTPESEGNPDGTSSTPKSESVDIEMVEDIGDNPTEKMY